MLRQGFIDWMKAIGMLLIVVGHVVGSPNSVFNLITQPIYTKQLGVCLFIFVMGWSLANERRTDFRVVFNRLVPVYFYGLLCTLIFSLIFIFTKGDINESNYLPFFLGLNVMINYFPANPSIWYIGTYLHILLFWYCFLRTTPITFTLVLQGAIVECLVRAVLLYFNQDFVAYMLLSNWLTVFLLGSYLAAKTDTQWQLKVIMLMLLWGIILVVWSGSWNVFFSAEGIPFRDITLSEASPSASLIPGYSLLITIIYAVNTWGLFELFRRLPKLRLVEFFARNSLITFIIHMPLIWGLMGEVYSWFEWEWLGRLCLILIIYVGCALFSEMVQRRINIKSVLEKSWHIASIIYERVNRIISAKRVR